MIENLPLNPMRKTLLFLLLPLFAFTVAHKFYISVTNVGYSDKDKSLQITSRIFIDDMEKALMERYDIRAQLATDDEMDGAKGFIEKYVRAKFKVGVNGESVPYDLLAIKYDFDVLICYLEVPNINLPKTISIEIQNDMLTDVFEEQQNVVHFKIKDKKKSFVLMRDQNKGMLNL
ncbi:MAG: DUF6702 family protein [Flavobacteriaceae bacterium]